MDNMTDRTGLKEVYSPSPETIETAYVKNRDEIARRAEKDSAQFWEECAKEFVWFEPWTKVLDDSNPPFYRWFVGARTNIVYNCLDRHVQTWRRNKLALI
jgi:acetyl-CoA synthetase